MIELMDHQKDAIKFLGSGKILWGGVGSGKSATILGYYVQHQTPRDIYVITTAKKRDSLDWEGEASKFGISTQPGSSLHGTITVDSWNNIGNYLHIKDAFFVFDEQRLVGNGAWVKGYLQIVKENDWVMLSATPGDTWLDYAPVFIANGFYRNITHFKREHVIYEPFTKFPKVRGYLKEVKLETLRNDILVEMPYQKDTERILNWFELSYDQGLYQRVFRDRWNPFEDEPIKDVAELWRLMRRVVNSDESRLEQVLWLMKAHPRLIIFYNFNYELEILRSLGTDVPVFEYNGHVKDPVPEGDKWVYLVQYVAGAEAWNCVSTNAMVLYSLTYSYKNFEQAQGRIDRLDTKYKELYYYIFISNSIVDRGIRASLDSKKSFNEKKYMTEMLRKGVNVWGGGGEF